MQMLWSEYQWNLSYRIYMTADFESKDVGVCWVGNSPCILVYDEADSYTTNSNADFNSVRKILGNGTDIFLC